MDKVRKVVRWIFGIIFVLGGLLEITGSIVAGIFWILAGILMLPPTSKKIPEFKCRKAVLAVGCIGLLLAGVCLMSGTEGNMQDIAQNQPESVKDVQKDAEGSSETEGKKAEEVKESSAKPKAEDKREQEEKEVFDADKLSKWLAETLYGNDSAIEELKVEDSDKENWGKISEEDFLPVWKKTVLNQLNERGEDYDMAVKDLERAIQLYRLIRESSESIAVIIQSADGMSEALQCNHEIEKKYNFDFMSAYRSYGTGDFYITGILETAYSDNVVGKLQKELDSYSEQEGSNWQAHNVEYIFNTATAGDSYWIIHADSISPFPREGAYNLVYFDTGEKIEIIRSGGFRENVPLLQLIEDGTQFTADVSLYSANETVYFDNYRKIRQELGNEIIFGQERNPEILENIDSGTEQIPYEEIAGSYIGIDGEMTCSLSMYSDIQDERLGTVMIMQGEKEYSGEVVEAKMNVYQVLMEDGTEIIFGISRNNAGDTGMLLYINEESYVLNMTEQYIS